MSRLPSMRGVGPFALSVAFVFHGSTARAEQSVALPTIEATAEGEAQESSKPAPNSPGPAPMVEKYQLPQTTESIAAKQIQETINIVDTEDAIKYLPSLFVRKRNNGDTQPVLATRTWGLNSSARSLVYADDILISALIANNNTIGAPRWGLVAPEEIQRIDFLYGPFSAAYPGNSIGGVMLITTRMPDKPEVTAKQTESFQTFSQYGTNNTYRTDQTSVSAGNRIENFWWFFGANIANSFSQPLSYVTTGANLPLPGTSGGYFAQNKLGQTANVLGAGGLLHTVMANVKLKLAYDFTPWLRGTYTLGYWSNDGQSNVQTYLNNAFGAPTFGGVAGFANSYYTITERHLANAVSLKTNTRGPFDWDMSASFYNMLQDTQRNPYGVIGATGFTTYGKIANLGGTNWENIDLKGIWRNDGPSGNHEVSFGLHGDQYNLNNPTYKTTTWNGGPDVTGEVYTSGVGATQTGALWAQDAWRIAPSMKLTVGGRLETWRAFDGFNLNTTQNAAGAITSASAKYQPTLNSTNFSPKVSLSWTPNQDWEVKGSFGEAYRYPTVSELYQVVSSGSTFFFPNPNLSPEEDLSYEVTAERKWVDGKVRLSLFQENVRSALISQTNFVNSGTTQANITTVSNVDATRNRGVELAWQKDNVGVNGLQFFGSVTYVDARIISDPTWTGVYVGTNVRSTVDGKRTPYVPDWRTTFGLTYRPDEHWAFTAAARYSGKMYSTMDNTDAVSNVYGAFDRYFVVDARIHYQLNELASFDFGVDNLNNEKYFLFHPFPKRTFVADMKIKF